MTQPADTTPTAEQPQPDPSPEPGTPDPTLETPEPEQPEPEQESPNSEAARWRVRLRETEAERDARRARRGLPASRVRGGRRRRARGARRPVGAGPRGIVRVLHRRRRRRRERRAPRPPRSSSRDPASRRAPPSRAGTPRGASTAAPSQASRPGGPPSSDRIAGDAGKPVGPNRRHQLGPGAPAARLQVSRGPSQIRCSARTLTLWSPHAFEYHHLRADPHPGTGAQPRHRSAHRGVRRRPGPHLGRHRHARIPHSRRRGGPVRIVDRGGRRDRRLRRRRRRSHRHPEQVGRTVGDHPRARQRLEPAAADVVGQGIVRDLVRKVDQALFTATTTNGPGGIPGVSGISTVDAGSAYANVDPFSDAIYTAAAFNGNITAWVTNPATAKTLAKVRRPPARTSRCSDPTRRSRAGGRSSAFRC